jgi:hypothetical protein
MKLLSMVAALMILCGTATATELSDWNGLPFHKSLKVLNDISLPVLNVEEAGVKDIKIAKSDMFSLFEYAPLGFIGVDLLRFNYLDCKNPKAKTDMIIFKLPSTGVEIGVEMEACVVEIFIESIDFGTEGIFTVLE